MAQLAGMVAQGLAVGLAWAFIFGALVVMALVAVMPSAQEGYERWAGQRLWELMLADERRMRGERDGERDSERDIERGTGA